MPFGCVPIRQHMLDQLTTPEVDVSPMPFGCVPIRQL